MPNFGAYQEIAKHKSVGEALKYQSDVIMNTTWWNDINSTVVYLYDCYHDSEPLKLRGLDSSKDPLKIAIDAKIVKNASQTYDKDQVTVRLQLRPGQECNVYYYEDDFEKRYGSIFPIGLYCDILDENGQYNRWLIVDKANFANVRQFPTYEILPCDKVFQYIIDRVKHQVAGVLRSQNSYNSGIWSDYAITSPEDQQKFVVPLNRDTEKIYYDLRMIIDSGVITEPRTWEVTKVNRISPNGIARITLAQNKFNQHTDYIETDDLGNVVGMWAGYYDTPITPTDPIPEITDLTCNITYSGTSPQIKVGGSYKKLTATFYKNSTKIDPIIGTWKFLIDGEDASDVITIIETETEPYQIKVKAPTDPEYIGKILTVQYVTDKVTGSLNVDIIAL